MPLLPSQNENDLSRASVSSGEPRNVLKRSEALQNKANLIEQRKVRAAIVSVVSNSGLVVAKLVIGLVIGSVSVTSEAIHSGVDLAAALIAWFAVRTAGKPADEDHPYGHGKVENVSGTIEALLIFAAAGWIIFEAMHKLTDPQPMENVGLGAVVMGVSSVVNILVSRHLFKVGSETDSVALQADAWHLRTDVYTSAGVMFGLALIWTGKLFFPSTSLDWVDPVAAIAVAALILKAAYDLTKQSAKDLLDAKLPTQEEKWIRDRIRSRLPTVVGYHDLRTRKAGSKRFVEFHMVVSPDMTVKNSHALITELADEIRTRFPESSVLIHVDPCCDPCPPDCIPGCMATSEQKRPPTGHKEPGTREKSK